MLSWRAASKPDKGRIWNKRGPEQNSCIKKDYIKLAEKNRVSTGQSCVIPSKGCIGLLACSKIDADFFGVLPVNSVKARNDLGLYILPPAPPPPQHHTFVGYIEKKHFPIIHWAYHLLRKSKIQDTKALKE